MKIKSLKNKTIILLAFFIIGIGLVRQSSTAVEVLATSSNQQRAYLTVDQYSILNEMFQVHTEYFLDSSAITSSGLPLTAYKVGDRARFGYSNPTEWGYALQAWIAAAERGIISQNEAVAKIGTALATMQALQSDPDENYSGLFYPFYTLTDSSGNDLSKPVHDTFGLTWFQIPSGDLALLYASLVVTQGWANHIGDSAIETQAASIKDNMDFGVFLFQENGGTYLAHQVNAITNELSSSKWDIFADEGGVVSWIAYFSGSVTFEEFKALTESQMRGSASWQSCMGKPYWVREATWFNAMFTLGVRSLAGFSTSDFDSPTGSLSHYSNYAFVPAVLGHLAYGDCLGVDYSAFSDAMTQTDKGQAIVGRYTPSNLANIAPDYPPDHVMPHAFFIPFNVGPDLPDVTVTRLISEVVSLRDDQAGYYHDSGSYPFGFEVVTSPYADDMSYDGADDGRPIFETLSQAYIVLSLFNGLQLHDGNETFYSFATYVPGYEDDLRQVLHYLYPNNVYLPIVIKPPCIVGEFRFGSGSSQYPEERSVTIGKNCIQEGDNTLVLKNANPLQTDHWIFWDSLNLKDSQGGVIWELGDNEAPPDYIAAAFDEFDNSSPYNTHFTISTMSENEFPAELNDFSISQVYIHFALTNTQASSDVTLYLDTLYATHLGASYFDMQVQVMPGGK